MAANYHNLSYIIGGFWYLERALLDEYDRVLTDLGVAPADSPQREP